jgi:hypothetical protein
MKTIAIAVLAAVLGMIAPARAQTPNLMNYQGVLKDNLGNPLTGSYSITFRLYDVATGGTALWTETQPSVSVANGLFSVLLGSVTALSPSNFSGPDRWLGVQVGADPEMTPRQRIASVAYALRTPDFTPVFGSWDAGANETGAGNWLWVTELYNTDPSSLVRAADNRSVTVLKAGYYAVHASVLQYDLADNERGDVYIQRNGANVELSLGYGQVGQAYYKHTLTYVGFFNANDTIAVNNASAGASRYGSGWSHLHIYRLR